LGASDVRVAISASLGPALIAAQCKEENDAIDAIFSLLFLYTFSLPSITYVSILYLSLPRCLSVEEERRI
jgi:hypothetical protein